MNKTLRELADVHYGKGPSEVLSEDGSFPVVGTGGIYGRAKAALFSGPAVVVARKGSLGNPQFMKGPFWPVDTTYAVVPKAGVEAKWLYYNLDKYDLTKLNEATGVPSISRDWLCRISFDDPGNVQQRRIAEILSTLDDAIEQTEALIAKMQQVKAGMMHDLFTRGVTPDGHLRPTREQAPDLYKESPLGWIPKEWEIGELRNWLSYISYGFTNPMPESDEGPYMLTAADINDGKIQYDTCRRTTAMAFERFLTQKSRPKIGDVLLTKDGTLGRLAVVDRPDLCINQSVAVLRPVDSNYSHFLAAMLSSPRWQQKMITDAGGSTIKHIYITIVDKMIISWPSNSIELDRISALMLNCSTVINEEEDGLRKLRQQKQGLMHDLLFGKVRVPK